MGSPLIPPPFLEIHTPLYRGHAMLMPALPSWQGKGKASCSMPASEYDRTLIVLNERGRVAKGDVFNDLPELHKLVEMIGLHKIGICPQR